MSRLTPSQTVGPYFRIGLDWPGGNVLVTPSTPGPHIVVQGRVFDGDGEPVPDAMLEIWQADAQGRFVSEPGDAFRGCGRCGVDVSGAYVFETVKPGIPSEAGVGHAPHINLAVFARGLLVHLYTRIYFDDEAEANRQDTILAAVPAGRRDTLIAKRDGDHYVFDVRLQGEAETVFFDV